MKPDDFEQQLQRQPLRQVPPEWRTEILRAARAESRPRPSTLAPRPSWLSILNAQLTTLLWPCPQAWAALAVVWAFILGLNLGGTAGQAPRTEAKAPVQREAIMAFAEQEKLLSEMFDSSPVTDADRPKLFIPRPRSERRNEMVTV